MKLWLIHQTRNTDWDTYDSAVVSAETEEEAKWIHPNKNVKWDGKSYHRCDTWCSVEFVKADYIGEAKEGTDRGVICASFNAG